MTTVAPAQVSRSAQSATNSRGKEADTDETMQRALPRRLDGGRDRARYESCASPERTAGRSELQVLDPDAAGHRHTADAGDAPGDAALRWRGPRRCQHRQAARQPRLPARGPGVYAWPATG